MDEYSRSSVPSIWAVGDVTDRINLSEAPSSCLTHALTAETASGSSALLAWHPHGPFSLSLQLRWPSWRAWPWPARL